MQLSTAEAERIMTTLGAIRKSCKHHVKFVIEHEGRIVVMAHFSFGWKDLPDHIPDRFRKSLHLSRPEFEMLRRGALSREEYLELLRAQGIVW
jgi:hypothetical protein